TTMKHSINLTHKSLLKYFTSWDCLFLLISKLPLVILTFTYSGAYKYHTLHPIRAIKSYQGDESAIIRSLVHFRLTKIEELRFIQGAATLSGAAVIGVFSWPTTEKTIWATKMLWNWSLFLSSFALIGSAHQRLLRHLPETVDEDFGQQKLKVALSLFLQPPVDKEMKGSEDSDKAMRSISRKMLWFWQCPTMLMSFSWVFFLIGYALHLLTPIFDPSQAEISRKVSQKWLYSTMSTKFNMKQAAIVTLCGCGLVVSNFVFCASLCQYRLSKAEKDSPKATMELSPV
ncbi:hypothetical protein KAF25_008636, partial [Fusarium avenaceum]